MRGIKPTRRRLHGRPVKCRVWSNGETIRVMGSADVADSPSTGAGGRLLARMRVVMCYTGACACVDVRACGIECARGPLFYLSKSTA